MREKLQVIFVLTMLLLVLVSPIGVSVGVVDFDGESGDFMAQSSVDWWPMFHHDLSHTGYSTSVVQEYIEPLWNRTTGGGVRCSPVVVDDRVFVGSEDGYVRVFNATTGDQIEKSPNIGAVISSPAVADGRVFVGSLGGSVYALRKTTLGIRWNFTTDGAVSSSPAVDGDKVFVGSGDHKIYALDAWTFNASGTEIWNCTTYGPVHSSPAVSGGAVFVGSDHGYVYKFKDGDEIWRFRTVDPVWSSPAVVDGKVFVGVDDGRVYALSATSGKYLWHFETKGAVRSSPAVADGRVFVGSNDAKVYALNATDGSLIWNFTTKGAVQSSPAVAGDKVFVGSDDSRIYALKVTNGSLIRNFTTGGPVVSSPAIAEGKVFVGSLDNKIYAFAANKPPQAFFNFHPTSPIVTQMVTFNASASYDPDGNITSYTWSFGDGTQVTEAYPIATHTYNVAGTYNVSLTLKDNFKPLGTNTTQQQITVREAWPMFRHDPTHIGNSTDVAPVSNSTIWNQTIGLRDESLWMYPSAAVIDNRVFFASSRTDGENGTVYALNANNGSVIWSTTPVAGKRIYSSPAVADYLVFVASEDGYIYVLNATNGNPIEWSPVEISPGTPLYSSPTIVGDRVFVGSQDRSVYAFNKTDGNKLWSSDPLGRAIDSSPAVADGRVYVGSDDHKVYALDAVTGAHIWNYTTGGMVESSPAVADGMVFVGSEDDKLYALDALTREKIWSYTTKGDIDSSPAVAHGSVFIGSMDGNVYALDALTGNYIWNRTIGSIRWSSPAVAEGKVFIGSENGKIYALYEESGDIVWSYQTDGPVDSSPAVLNDTLYVSSKDGKIYAFQSQVHDIAVTEVTFSETEVPQEVIIDIDATMRNEGTFNEANINVTASYSNSTFSGKAGNITIASLARGAKITELIRWNTTNVTPGNYSICVYATPVANETETLDNNQTYSPVTINPKGIRDIAVTNVTRSKTVVGQNCTVSINVTIENQGNYTETFDVTAYADLNTTIIGDEITIGNQKVPSLTSGNSTTVTFTWNTTGLAKGNNYTISANATILPGETDLADNNLTDGWVKVTIPGDVNGDCVVDMADISMMIEVFMTHPSDPKYASCDVNCDGMIDMADISIAIANFMKTCQDDP